MADAMDQFQQTKRSFYRSHNKVSRQFVADRIRKCEREFSPEAAAAEDNGGSSEYRQRYNGTCKPKSYCYGSNWRPSHYYKRSTNDTEANNAKDKQSPTTHGSGRVDARERDSSDMEHLSASDDDNNNAQQKEKKLQEQEYSQEAVAAAYSGARRKDFQRYTGACKTQIYYNGGKWQNTRYYKHNANSTDATNAKKNQPSTQNGQQHPPRQNEQLRHNLRNSPQPDHASSSEADLAEQRPEKNYKSPRRYSEQRRLRKLQSLSSSQAEKQNLSVQPKAEDVNKKSAIPPELVLGLERAIDILNAYADVPQDTGAWIRRVTATNGNKNFTITLEKQPGSNVYMQATQTLQYARQTNAESTATSREQSQLWDKVQVADACTQTDDALPFSQLFITAAAQSKPQDHKQASGDSEARTEQNMQGYRQLKSNKHAPGKRVPVSSRAIDAYANKRAKRRCSKCEKVSKHKKRKTDSDAALLDMLKCQLMDMQLSDKDEDAKPDDGAGGAGGAGARQANLNEEMPLGISEANDNMEVSAAQENEMRTEIDAAVDELLVFLDESEEE